MLAAFDIGNSNTSIGVHDGRSWRALWRLRTDQRRTNDELRIILRSLFAANEIDPQSCNRAVLAAVVPAAVPALQAAVEELCACPTLIVESGIRTGMRVRYRPAQALGADRLADVVAGRDKFGAPVVVVDFGTATTFNAVDQTGDFVGGAIAPGVGTAATALAAAGARLTPVDFQGGDNTPSIGRNTAQAMRGGILHGYAGLVAGLLARFDRELGCTPPVVATGGHARALCPLVSRISHHEPVLTLDGLRLLAALNP